MVVQNFCLTQLEDVFVISHPCCPAFPLFSPVRLNHHLGTTFNMGHWGGFFFFFKGSWKNGVIRNWSILGQSMKDGLSEECFHEVGVSF